MAQNRMAHSNSYVCIHFCIHMFVLVIIHNDISVLLILLSTRTVGRS